MNIEFYKYHGAGNDFVMIDNRSLEFPVDERLKIVQTLCQRHFGIGSDGLILIQHDAESDFYMEFYNPDGSQSFCGNGSRCAVMFAFHLGMINKECSFRSIHGRNEAKVVGDSNVKLQMFDVKGFEIGEHYHYLNTGSPHYNVFVNSVDDADLIKLAKEIRYGERFKDVGTNVNIIEELNDGSIKVRTYERGVEGETLACGTGVTACAISKLISSNSVPNGPVVIHVKGGLLKVEVKKLDHDSASGLTLEGPAQFVFKGEVNV